MDMDYAIKKDESPTITDKSSPTVVALYERWDQSNRLSVMFINTKISTEMRGSVDQHEKVWNLLKAIDDQFITSDKALASTLMKFSFLQLNRVKGVQEWIHNTNSWRYILIMFFTFVNDMCFIVLFVTSHI